MAGPTWDDTTEDTPSWDDTTDPSWDDTQPEASGYEGFAKKALPVIQTVMEAPERYIAAPTRAAIDATLHKPFGFDAIPAFANQFGEDPSKAPTAGRIMNRLGVNVPSVDVPTPFKNFDGSTMKANTKNVAEGLAGAAMDPTMYMFPEIGPTARTAGRMMEGAAEGAAKKMARITADVPEAATERFIRNPRAVNEASSNITPHVGRWNEMVDQLRTKVKEGSGESRAALEGQKYPLQDIGDVFDQVKQEIIRESEGAVDPNIERRLGALESMRKAYMPKFEERPTGFLNLDGTTGQKRVRTSPENLSGNRVKNLVQDLQRGSNFSRGGADFIELSDIDKNKAMGALNRKLKDNPQFAEIMRGVADDMDLLQRADALGKTDNALEGVFRNFGKTRENPVNLIREVDSRLGTSFYDELLNTSAKRSFENTPTNGSRRAVMGFASGSPAWAIMHDNPVMAALTQVATTAGGFAADKYGGTMVKGAVRGMTFPTRAARGIAEAVGERLPRDSRYWKILTEAANKSPKALVVTHHLLMSSDPEYRKTFSDQP